MMKNWDKLWAEKGNYSWWSDPRVNPGDPDDPEVWLSMIKAEGDKFNRMREAAKNACLQMDTIDTAHKGDELAKLPHRILRILGDS